MKVTTNSSSIAAPPLIVIAVLDWGVTLLVALILLQTLFFKFTAAPESVYIFTTVGIEPFGRIGSGVVELIASLLLLYPATRWIGAFLSLGVISGAIMSHLTILGIEVLGDGGYLFYLGLTVFFGSAFILFLNKDKPLQIISSFLKPKAA
jgi:hypothetical protein